MDLPPAFFPSIYKHHGSQHIRRDYFLDYGSHMNIDVDTPLTLQEGELNIVSQKCHPVHAEHLHLSAVLPALPISDQPADVPYPFQDQVGDKVKYNQEEAIFFIKKMFYYQGRLRAKSGSQFQLNIMDAGGQVSRLDQTDGVCGLNSCKHPGLDVMWKEYHHYLNNSKFIRVNSAYTGGCLSCLHFSGHTCLIHPTGEHFDTLNVVEVYGERLLGQRALYQVKLESPVLEMTSAYLNNAGYCCVRADNGYSLYHVAKEGAMIEPFRVDHRHMSQDKPTSVCLSPYIPGEVLVSTVTGSVHLTALDHSVQILLPQQPQRFPVQDQWRQVNWAAHPRQFVLADRTCVQLFDSRTKYSECLDLFAQPTKLLHQEERVMVTQSHPDIPYYQLIATDMSLLLVDQRLPNYPVMLWSLSLPAAPQYLSLVPQDNSNSLILVASQTPPHTHCYHVSYGEGRPAQSGYQAWKLSSISDLTRYEINKGFVDQMLLGQRLNASLAGVSGCQTQDSVYTYQLNSHGEVFYQVYRHGDSGSDKTCSWVPGGMETLPTEANEIAEMWLERLQAQFDQLVISYSVFQPLNVSHKLDSEASSSPFPHVLCPLCMPGTTSLVPTGQHCEEDDSIGCRKCGHSLHQAHTISHHTEKRVVENDSIHEDLFNASIPQLQDLPQMSANTKLLLGLWNEDEDIEEFVKSRERERQQIEQKRQEIRSERRAHRKDKEKPTVLDMILATSQPTIVEDVYEMQSERSKDERRDNSEEMELQTGLERVRISPPGKSGSSQQQRHMERNDECHVPDSSAKTLTHTQTGKHSHSDSDLTSDLTSQRHGCKSLTFQPGFSSVPPRFHPASSPSSPLLLSEAGSEFTDDEKFFSQEVRESLEMPLCLNPLKTEDLPKSQETLRSFYS